MIRQEVSVQRKNCPFGGASWENGQLLQTGEATVSNSGQSRSLSPVRRAALRWECWNAGIWGQWVLITVPAGRK